MDFLNHDSYFHCASRFVASPSACVFLLGEVAFPQRKKVSRRRSVRGCLAGRASRRPCFLGLALLAITVIHPSLFFFFFFLFHTSTLYPSSSTIALRPHCGIDRKTSPVSLLSAGRHVYHGSAIPLSPLTSGLEHNGEAAVLPLPVFQCLKKKKKNLFVSLLRCVSRKPGV